MIRVALALSLLAGCAQADSSPQAEGASELLHLDNGATLRAVIAPRHGGELAGLAFRFDDAWHELIYRARDYTEAPGWRGKAPLLWPAVGVSLDPEGEGRGYRIEGRHHSMPPHGFARDRAWRVLRHEPAAEPGRAVLALASDEATRVLYPFDFELQVEYRLTADRLTIEYRLSAAAANTAPMPFCIGNHITFKAPLIPGSAAGEVRFHTGLPEQFLREDDRSFAGRVAPSPFRAEQPLSALPRRSAVSLGGRPGPAELTVIDPSGLRVVLRHAASAEPAEPAIRFNLWADTVEGFFSPEPWLGTQNGLNTGAGLIRLEPGERWTWRIEVVPTAGSEFVSTYHEESS